jgi:DNA polymerase/3'-5' exonuclease PolX
MNLAGARAIAEEVRDALSPDCERIQIAGSIRRGKPEVKDIEIVYIPRMILPQPALFDLGLSADSSIPATDRAIDDLIANATLARDDKVKRWGPKYKRAVHVQTGMVVELFAATGDNWGYIYALRTGPAEFNHLLVTKKAYGGAMPADMYVHSGYLWHTDGEAGAHTCCHMPSEEVFFATLQLPCWPPEERTAERLAGYLRG